MLRLPIVKQLFSANDEAIRSSEGVIDAADAAHYPHSPSSPPPTSAQIYMRTRANMGFGGPPPLINVGGAATVTPPGAPGAGAPGATGAAAPGAVPRSAEPAAATAWPADASAASAWHADAGSGDAGSHAAVAARVIAIPGTTAVPVTPPQPQSGVTVFAPTEPPPAARPDPLWRQPPTSVRNANPRRVRRFSHRPCGWCDPGWCGDHRRGGLRIALPAQRDARRQRPVHCSGFNHRCFGACRD